MSLYLSLFLYLRLSFVFIFVLVFIFVCMLVFAFVFAFVFVFVFAFVFAFVFVLSLFYLCACRYFVFILVSVSTFCFFLCLCYINVLLPSRVLKTFSIFNLTVRTNICSLYTHTRMHARTHSYTISQVWPPNFMSIDSDKRFKILNAVSSWDLFSRNGFLCSL